MPEADKKKVQEAEPGTPPPVPEGTIQLDNNDLVLEIQDLNMQVSQQRMVNRRLTAENLELKKQLDEVARARARSQPRDRQPKKTTAKKASRR